MVVDLRLRRQEVVGDRSDTGFSLACRRTRKGRDGENGFMLHRGDFAAENGVAVQPPRLVRGCAWFRRREGNAMRKSWELLRRPSLEALPGSADLRGGNR
jgi:hypothetical protein